MKVSDARRDRQSTGAEHRRNVQVLGAILDNRHSAGGERAGQRRIDNDLCRGSLPLRGITGAGRQTSVAFCAIAVIAYNTMTTTDSRNAPFELVYFRFAMFFPLIPTTITS
jgi:hypothetical protein